MKRLIISRADGGVTVGTVLQGAPKESFDKWVLGQQEIRPHWLPATWEFKDVTLPDRVFRNAWEAKPQGVDVNMPAARVIHMAKIRRARDRALEVLDKDWMKETGQGDTAAAAATEAARQVLREIPQTFDLELLPTPEALDAAWPPGLPRS